MSLNVVACLALWLYVWPCGFGSGPVRLSGPANLSGLVVICLVLLLCVWTSGYMSGPVGVWPCVCMSGPVSVSGLAPVSGPVVFASVLESLCWPIWFYVLPCGLCAALWVCVLPCGFVCGPVGFGFGPLSLSGLVILCPLSGPKIVWSCGCLRSFGSLWLTDIPSCFCPSSVPVCPTL